MKEYSISKIDAARRQLDEAIRLYMSQRDDLSIHTLACASHSILNDLTVQNGEKGYMLGVFKEKIKPEKQKEVVVKLREVQNFLKHADKDPNANIKFKPEATELWLWDACLMYQVIAGELTDYMNAYLAWFAIQKPQIFTDREISEKMEKFQSNYKTRKEFMDVFMEALRDM